MELTESQIRALREAAASLEEMMNRLKHADLHRLEDTIRELERAQPHLKRVQRISSIAIPHPFFGTKIRETLEAFRGE